MKFLRQHFALLLILVAIVAFATLSYSWTFTPHGRLDYRAALSLRLMSFERTFRPDPAVDFEISMPVNLIYALSFALPKEDVQQTRDLVIPGPQADMPARVYWPIEAGDAAALPVIVFYHGGGFVVGNIDIFDSLTRALANATSSIVVSAGYRLAPAHPYPAATIDAYAALEWVAGNIAELGGDPDKLIVAGESAGGNLATVVALKARDSQGPRIAAEILYYPATDFTDTPYPSRQRFADGYGLSSSAMSAFQRAYAGQVADKTTPYLSPMYAPSLANMPPTLMVTAGFDPLADSGMAYARRLENDAVAVTEEHFPGMIHGFMNIRLFPQRRQALETTAAFLQEVFANAH